MNEPTQDRDTQELLPWYVNGTLEADEREAVEALLERSAEARLERDAWARIAGCARLAPEIEAPSELGWHRLRREIRRRTPETENAPTRARAPWKALAAAVATVVICVQAALLWNLPGESLDTQLLGGTAPAVDAGGSRVQVRFADGTRWDEVAGLLAELDAEIVSGPSALGVTVIRLAPGGRGEPTPAERLARLERSPAVEYARVLQSD